MTGGNQNAAAPSGDFLGREMRARLRMPAPVEPEPVDAAAQAAAAGGLGGGPAVVVPRGESLDDQIRERVFGG